MKNKKRTKNGGFTLVELLATLAILSLIFSITIYAVTGVIDKAKEKGYETTKNNIVVTAKNFMRESTFSWFDSDEDNKCVSGKSTCQYQCITVKNLIDSGYFDNNILESKISEEVSLSKENVVYLERDKTTKTITHQIFDNNDTPCEGVNSDGSVSIVVNESGWRKAKTATITYKVNDYDVNNYEYVYSFNGGIEIIGKFTSSTMTIITDKITSNGTLYARIRKAGVETPTVNSQVISQIDNTLPTITLSFDNRLAEEKKVIINLSDVGSGISGYYFGTKDLEDETLLDDDFKPVSNQGKTSATVIEDITTANGLYWYFVSKDMVGNRSIISGRVFNKTLLKTNVSGVTPTISELVNTPSYKYDLNRVKLPTSANYKIAGWYTDVNLTKPVSNPGDVKLNSYRNLYAKLVENKIESANVTVNTAGPNLIATVSNVTLNNGGNTNGITYEYQWYYNSTNSNVNGEPFINAKLQKLSNYSSYAGRCIYVSVKVKKANYPDATFTSNCYCVKSSGFVNLSSTGTTVTMKSTPTLTFTINNHHGGVLSVTDNNSTLVSSISGNTVTLSNVDKLSSGTYTVTVTSGETELYNSKSGTYTLKVNCINTCPTGTTEISGKCCPSGYTSVSGNYCVKYTYTVSGNKCQYTAHASYDWSMTIYELNNQPACSQSNYYVSAIKENGVEVTKCRNCIMTCQNDDITNCTVSATTKQQICVQ